MRAKDGDRVGSSEKYKCFSRYYFSVVIAIRIVANFFFFFDKINKFFMINRILRKEPRRSQKEKAASQIDVTSLFRVLPLYLRFFLVCLIHCHRFTSICPIFFCLVAICQNCGNYLHTMITRDSQRVINEIVLQIPINRTIITEISKLSGNWRNQGVYLLDMKSTKKVLN